MFEVRAINFIYGLEVAKIGQENCRLSDVIKRKAFGSQNGCDVVQNSPGLRGDVAGNDLTRLGVEWDLAATKEEPSAAHRLRVGADCRRRFVRGNDLLHAADCNCKFKPHNESKSLVRCRHFGRSDGNAPQGRGYNPCEAASTSVYGLAV